MAKYVTVKLFIDAEPAADAVNEILRPHLFHYQESRGLIDYKILKEEPVPAEIEDSLCNETYEEGDMS